ncbi:MAG: heme-binding protein [Halobacteriaceae archaeon]
MPEAPDTAEGWYVLHDFRAVDWDGWRGAAERDREAAIGDGIDYLEAVAAPAEGASAVFSVVGHKADLLLLHFRPTLDAVERAERRFEGTAFAGFTEQTGSYVSVTEVSGYASREYFEGGDVDEGLESYIQDKLHPSIPEDTYVSFYPMAKRRGPEHNWYALDFEERAALMAEHGETGREFAGRIRQVIASSVGLDDWEWGVTLFGDDPTDIKDVVYEMRFDEASALYGEFGQFYVGRRFPPADLRAYMAGEHVPSDADREDGGETTAAGEGGPPTGERASTEAEIREALADRGVYAGQPHGEDVYAMVLYSGADADELAAEVDGLRGNFEHYDTHVKTAVYATEDADRTAVVSLWETAGAAETAGGFLADLPGVEERADEADGFGTMGMFYTVKPEHREEFVEKFETVGGLLDEMEGHRGTDLLVNRGDENDMFIASRWDSREDAMGFFRSEEFQDTVEWGRDVLADRPRHVFLA